MAKKTWIKIKRGLLEPKHRERLGIRIWLYLYILDRVDWETGTVLDWRDEAEADELDMPVRTLRAQRQELEGAGYISCRQRKDHQTIIVHNWTNPREYSGEVYNPKGDTFLPPSENDDENEGDMFSHEGDIKGDIKGISKHVTPTLYSHITEGIQPQGDIPESDTGNRLYDMAYGISLLCRVDFDLNQRHLFRLARSLLDRGFALDQVMRIYGKGGSWWSEDWRGKKGELPTPQSIRETITRLVTTRPHQDFQATEVYR